MPTYMLAITPQKRPGWSLIIIGPGTMLWIISAPSSMPMTTLAGIPRVSSGMNAPWAAALFADSGAATPAMAPLPNFSGVFDRRFSMP